MKINSIFSKIFMALFCLACCLNIAAKSSGTCGAGTWELTDDGILTISGKGNMPNYSYQENMLAPWDSQKETIHNVIIENGITRIGAYAFWYCNNLENIVLPNSITAIAYNAFTGCANLTNLKIPSGCTTLGDNAFNGCSALKKLELPTTVTYIGHSCFRGCSSLLSISIPNGITEIKDWTFEGCSNLREIKLPNTITTIGEDAFSGCASLEEVKLPEATNTIGKSAFSYCNKLRIINIPSTVTNIGSDCFYRSNNLQRININDFAAWCEIKFGGEFPTNKLYINGNPISLENLTIPENVKKIGSYAFANCKEMKHVKLSNSITTIEYRSFANCESLIGISLSKNLKTIGQYCFGNCVKLSDIDIPESCTTIQASAFANCDNLKSITIPSTCTTIHRNAFEGSNNISDIYCKTSTPPNIYIDTFTESTYQNAILHVPSNTKTLYKNTDVWNKFEQITENGEKPETAKCDSPTISYQDGKLIFNCSTPNATYNYDITDGDTGTGFKTTEKYITLYGKYYISVYAIADGYKPSDTVTGTLYWIGGDLQTDRINTVKLRGIIASYHDGFISLSGLNNNELVKFYTPDGKLIGTQYAIDGKVNYAVSSSTSTLVIAKVMNNNLKIAIH